MRANSFQPERESVDLTRAVRDPYAPENLEIITASFSRGPWYYDPLFRMIRSTDEMLALLDEADTTGRPLFVNLGRTGLARKESPELMALMEQGDLFEEVETMWGLEPRGQRVVYRYRGTGVP